MPGLQDLELQLRYSTGQDDLVGEFFQPCLTHSQRYDRAVGYFSSTFYVLIRMPLAEFADRGGRMRIVCSPHLSPEDIEAIRQGYDERGVGEALNRELDEMSSDEVSRAAATMLGALISKNVVEMKIAFNRNNTGLFHDKVGIFTDAFDDCVSFTGSANETWSAWSGLANHESFHVHRSWTAEGGEHVAADVASFERLWSNTENGVEVIDFPDVALERLKAITEHDDVAAAQEALDRQIVGRTVRPTLRDHQKDAISGWIKADYRGIFEHATGSGKTITALNCINLALKDDRGVLVVVPSRQLLRQWALGLRAFFGDCVSVLLAGGGHNAWKQGSVLRGWLSERDKPRVVLAVMATACSEDFLNRTSDIERLCLVADEVHRIGSPTQQRILTIAAEWRLGLSATWEREGDTAGTDLIQNYFGGVIEPPYTLADAIRDGHLCDYRYFVHQVTLDDDERNEWREISKQIGRSIARARGEMDEPVKRLLIKRARVIKSARAKVSLTADLLQERYEPGQAWLVYCDGIVQLEAVRDALHERDIRTMEFHTQAVGAADVDLSEFADRGGVMLSINCLDEGVDIPRISHALILASSTTRREFIQRRGRVLRQHDTKVLAEIHDALVVPGDSDDAETATFIRREVARAIEFSGPATSSQEAEVQLRMLAQKYDLDITLGGVADGSDVIAEEDGETE